MHGSTFHFIANEELNTRGEEEREGEEYRKRGEKWERQ